MSDPSAPIYYAHLSIKNGKRVFNNASTSRPWLDLFGFDDPVVAIRLRERVDGDPESGYWAWVAANGSYYAMVWPTEIQFSMCFPYGYRAEEKLGRGRAVNLIVTEVEHD